MSYLHASSRHVVAWVVARIHFHGCGLASMEANLTSQSCPEYLNIQDDITSCNILILHMTSASSYSCAMTRILSIIGYICTCRSTGCCMRGELLMPYPSKPKASENIALSAKCGDITRVILGRAWVSPMQMCKMWAMSVCLSVCPFTRFMVNTHLWTFLASWQKWFKSQVSVNDKVTLPLQQQGQRPLTDMSLQSF